MQLNVLERLILLNILPTEGSFTNLKLVRVTRENLSFTEEENKALNFRQEGAQLVWNDFDTFNKSTGEPIKADSEFAQKMIEKNPDAFERRAIVGEKEIEIGEVVTKLIVGELEKLDKEEKLQSEQMGLYSKFME